MKSLTAKFPASGRARRLAATLFTLAMLAAIAAIAVSGAKSAQARASQPVAYVSDYDSRDWCDDYNDVDWDDCGGDVEGPTGPTGPSGPTAEPEWPPVAQWPEPPRGAYAKLRANGRTATIPRSAPHRVKQMIKAANSLTRKPYVWGGGHSGWSARGYDCSGATSYVLRSAGLVSWPMVSGQLARWGLRGEGRWVQVYAHSKHVFMVIAGLRFDTSGMGERGPRWRVEPRFTSGFRLRHPAKL